MHIVTFRGVRSLLIMSKPIRITKKNIFYIKCLSFFSCASPKFFATVNTQGVKRDLTARHADGVRVFMVNLRYCSILSEI